MGNYFASAPELLSVRLFLREPLEELWFPEGSAATLEEVLASIESWLSPSLRELPEHDRPRRCAHSSATSLERWATSWIARANDYQDVVDG